MLVFDAPGLQNKTWMDIAGVLGKVTLPRRPILLPKTVYSRMTNITFVEKMFVFNCWRQTRERTNPAHLFMGMGKLFVHSSYNESFLPFDTVLYHHCPSIGGWPWGEFVEELIWDYATSMGAVLDVGAGGQKIVLPYYRGGGDIANSNVICGKAVYQEPFSVAHWLGHNKPEDIRAWRKLVQRKFSLSDEQPRNVSPTSAGVVSRYDKNCVKSLKVAAWKRTEGTALRRMTNMAQVKNLVADYTDIPLIVLNTHSKMLPRDQISVFQSFDILISTHGSQLTNMVFGRENAVYIEVVAVDNDKSFVANGRSFAKAYIYSVGHLPANNPSLLKEMESCLSTAEECTSFSKKRQFQQLDLIVNISILRRDLEDALAVLC